MARTHLGCSPASCNGHIVEVAEAGHAAAACMVPRGPHNRKGAPAPASRLHHLPRGLHAWQVSSSSFQMFWFCSGLVLGALGGKGDLEIPCQGFPTRAAAPSGVSARACMVGSNMLHHAWAPSRLRKATEVSWMPPHSSQCLCSVAQCSVCVGCSVSVLHASSLVGIRDVFEPGPASGQTLPRVGAEYPSVSTKQVQDAAGLAWHGMA